MTTCITLLGLQSRFGDKALGIRVVSPQNGTAVPINKRVEVFSERSGRDPSKIFSPPDLSTLHRSFKKRSRPPSERTNSKTLSSTVFPQKSLDDIWGRPAKFSMVVPPPPPPPYPGIVSLPLRKPRFRCLWLGCLVWVA